MNSPAKKDDHVGLKLRSYTFTRKLGAGAWATVYEVFDDKTHTSVACKVIAKRLMDETPKLKELVQTEITVLQRCCNDNVIHYIDSFSSSKNVYILTEFCNGGDLEEYIRKKGKLREDEAREFLRQILNGFRGLHEVGAMHRDFKSANILLHNGVAKIADLGFAKILKNQIVTGTILGTSVTMAPELLENKSYGLQCDIWSLGVVYYQFLTGEYPYNAINDFEILKKIKSGPPKFPENIKITEQSKDFIRKCLTVDPKKRITWKAIYQHPLLNDKKGNFRQTYLGSLKSKISMGDNKKFYDKNVNMNQQQPQQQPGEMYPAFEFKGAELTTTEDFDKVRKEMEMRKEMDSAIIHYSQVYLEYRNMIMLTFKHGIMPIYEISSLPINQNLYAFLMCKRAFIDMSTFRSAVLKKSNIFNLAKFFNEFLASPEYARIIEQVNSDHQIINMYAQSFMAEVKCNNPKVMSELNLQSVTPIWQTIYREELNSYAFQLFDYRDRPEVNKDTVMRLMTFVCDLINGIKVSTEEYNRRIESLDIGFMEKQFGQRIQALYGQGK